MSKTYAATLNSANKELFPVRINVPQWYVKHKVHHAVLERDL